ncbi:MAG TPA: Hsp20/alpha crystallin family protein [Thermodesulfovibrionales bacterium]|nr:Hsp20/alpha crystallin family protein [Thermodesulfovibrionales bacterium]
MKTVTMVVKAGLRMRKEDIGVKRTETTMTILGEKREKEKVAKENYCRIGSSYGSFSRSGQKKEKKVSIK